MQIRQLTFLRFVAAMTVVIFHFGRHTPFLAWGRPMWDVGDAAVSFFFALSGFVLAHVYGERGVRRLSDFFVARFARLVPVYFLGLVAMALYAWHKHDLSAVDLGLSALLVQAWVPNHSQVLNVPGWSLSVEVFFYACFPWVVARLARVRSTGTLVTTFLVVWTLNVVMHGALLHLSAVRHSSSLRELAVYSPATHLATFVCGVIGGLLFARMRHRDGFRRHAAWLIVVPAALGVGLVCSRSPVLALHGNGLFTPLFVAFILGVAASPTSGFSRVLGWSPLVLLGEASYGVYILQGPVSVATGAALKEMNPKGNAYFIALATVLVAVSVLCFRFFETPLRERIKRRFGVGPSVQALFVAESAPVSSRPSLAPP